jgi:hypothetical protein
MAVQRPKDEKRPGALLIQMDISGKVATSNGRRIKSGTQELRKKPEPPDQIYSQTGEMSPGF